MDGGSAAEAHSIQVRYPIIPLPICFTRSFRMAASMRKRIVQDFQSQLYKTCGIRSLVFTAYESEERDLKICMYVIRSTYVHMALMTEHAS
jgi:hypothetical protein